MASTTGTLGFRVVGGKMLSASGEWVRIGYKHGEDVKSESELVGVLGRFLCTPGLKASALANVKKTREWWLGQERWALYASSLLFAYSSSTMDHCRCSVIDFANHEVIGEKAQDLSGWGTG